MSLFQETPANQAAPAARTRPMTGDEYLESLRDERAVYLYGERVEDVTKHPAFRNLRDEPDGNAWAGSFDDPAVGPWQLYDLLQAGAPLPNRKD